MIASVRGSRRASFEVDLGAGLTFLGVGLDIFWGLGVFFAGLGALFLTLGTCFFGVGLEGVFLGVDLLPKLPMSFLAKLPRGAAEIVGSFMGSR